MCAAVCASPAGARPAVIAGPPVSSVDAPWSAHSRVLGCRAAWKGRVEHVTVEFRRARTNRLLGRGRGIYVTCRRDAGSRVYCVSVARGPGGTTRDLSHQTLKLRRVRR